MAFSTTAEAVLLLGKHVAALAALPDDALVAAHSLLAQHRQHTETYVAWLAGEIARRAETPAPREGNRGRARVGDWPGRE